MNLNALSYGQIVFYSGVSLIIIGVVAIVIGLIVYSGKKKTIKKQLIDKYGF